MAYINRQKMEADKLRSVRNLDGVLDSVIENISQRGSLPRYPIALMDLDEHIWGVHKKELLIIGGRPAEGKTSMSLQFAWNLANSNHRVLYASLEMSKEQLTERLLIHVMEINNSELRHGIINDEIKNKMLSFKNVAKDIPLLITDNIGYNVREVEFLVSALEPKIDILILDYIQLCHTGQNGNRVDSITEYLIRIKELCIKYNFAAVVCSQINRAAPERKDKRPQLQDLKGSGSLEESADTVILLYWPYNNEPNITDTARFELLIEKQRHGPVGRVEVNFLPHYFKFTDREKYIPHKKLYED